MQVNFRGLMVAALLVVAGCASKEPEPPVVVPASTWEWVDWAIIAASQSSAEEAKQYAAKYMGQWRELVHQRTDTDFIPWYSGYWTQQWLGMKVAWYNVREGGETEGTVNRLASYLQEAYQDLVLEPVAETLSPAVIREQTTHFYVYHLGKKLQEIPQSYAVPQDQFEQRLQTVSAIALVPSASGRASLYQVVHANPLNKLPAYKVLVGRINVAGEQLAENSSGSGISAVARQASEKLESQLAARGVASTVSSVLGKAASLIISVGSVSYGVAAHEFEKPEMEAQLRQTLNKAFDQDWRQLMNNHEAGVLAGVYYLSAEIEADRLRGLTRPLGAEQPEAGVPAPGAPPLEYRNLPVAPVDYLDMFRAQ